MANSRNRSNPDPLPNPVGHLIRNHSAIQRLLASVAADAALLESVRDQLPEELRPHCLAAQLRNDQLLLFASSPTWATRLRYLATDLLRTTGEGTRRVSRVKVKVQENLTPRPAARSAARLSRDAVELLENYSQSVSYDPLRQALLRLARAGKPD